MSRLGKKRAKVEELTGTHVDLINTDGRLHAYIEMPTSTWHESGSARELIAWMEGIIVGHLLESGELERRATGDPTEPAAGSPSAERRAQ